MIIIHFLKINIRYKKKFSPFLFSSVPFQKIKIAMVTFPVDYLVITTIPFFNSLLISDSAPVLSLAAIKTDPIKTRKIQQLSTCTLV